MYRIPKVETTQMSMNMFISREYLYKHFVSVFKIFMAPHCPLNKLSNTPHSLAYSYSFPPLCLYSRKLEPHLILQGHQTMTIVLECTDLPPDIALFCPLYRNPLDPTSYLVLHHIYLLQVHVRHHSSLAVFFKPQASLLIDTQLPADP